MCPTPRVPRRLPRAFFPLFCSHQVIEYLQNPALMRQQGIARIGGLLLAGAPGTGKTLLAKAIAAESGVRMFTCSGTDFVDVGVWVWGKRGRGLGFGVRGYGYGEVEPVPELAYRISPPKLARPHALLKPLFPTGSLCCPPRPALPTFSRPRLPPPLSIGVLKRGCTPHLRDV